MDEIERLGAALDAEADAMRLSLEELVEIPTENPPGREYDACVERLGSILRRLGIDYERVELPTVAGSRRTAVVAEVGSSGRTLYFHGHYDVVPAASRDQFVPNVSGDALFGRGSSDMKGGLVSMMFAAGALATTGALGSGRVRLVMVPDEETGGAHGTAALFAVRPLDAGAVGMLLAEPTSGAVWNGNRGALSLEITVKGRAAHVGLQHLGVNAFEQALTVINQVIELKRDLPAGSVLLVGGRVQAGSNFNVVPETCRFTIDRRTNPDEDLEHAKRRLFDIFDQSRADGVQLDVEILQEGRSSASSADTAVGRALAASIERVCGAPATFECCPGLLETRFYAAQGVPALAYGPGILAVSHGPKEFVRLGRVVECARIYAEAAVRVFAGVSA